MIILIVIIIKVTSEYFQLSPTNVDTNHHHHHDLEPTHQSSSNVYPRHLLVNLGQSNIITTITVIMINTIVFHHHHRHLRVYRCHWLVNLGQSNIATHLVRYRGAEHLRGFLSQDLLQIFFTISLDPMNERSLGVISVSPYAANVTKVHFC